MATIIRHILDGIEYIQPRQSRDLKVLATFDGDSVQANITTTTFNFIDTENSKAATAIKTWFETLPTEGMPYTIVITDGTNEISTDYYLQFENYRVLSDVECEITVQKDNGLVSLDDAASGLTMQLLVSKGILTSTDNVRVAYIVENRKTVMEFITMVIQLVVISKMIKDEIFKLQAIIADIASGAWFTTFLAAVFALINLTITIINLVLLTILAAKLLKDMQQAYFPMIRYHFGINIKNWVVKALDFLGYGFETNPGFEAKYLDRTIMLGSKSDEVGPLAAAVEFGDLLDVIPPVNAGSGIISPDDFGYTLQETFELLNRLFHTKVAVLSGSSPGDPPVVHIRPFNDPFWTQSATYIFPNVKIETAFIENGTKRFNVEEAVSRTVIRYAKDDSDLHTLTNVNGRISEVIFSPITVSNQKHVNIRGLDLTEIGWALCVRKESEDKLFEFFKKVAKLFNTVKDEAKGGGAAESEEGSGSVNTEGLDDIEEFVASAFKRAGSLIVENHFFDVPKIVYLDPATARIPPDFKDIIGADELWKAFHSYRSLVQGDKNPDIPEETNQKTLFDAVSIPFGITDFQQTILNSFFEFEDSKTGKFTRLEWDVYRDRADTDFYVFENWNNNIQSELV